jgi:hypothetical protein
MWLESNCVFIEFQEGKQTRDYKMGGICSMNGQTISGFRILVRTHAACGNVWRCRVGNKLLRSI